MSLLDFISDIGDWAKGTTGGMSNAGLASTAAAGLAKISGLDKYFDPQIPEVGYQGKIPEYSAVKERVGGTYDPNRRPGSGGQRYFLTLNLQKKVKKLRLNNVQSNKH